MVGKTSENGANFSRRFPNPEMTSSDVKDVQFYAIEEKRNPKVFTFKKPMSDRLVVTMLVWTGEPAAMKRRGQKETEIKSRATGETH